MKTEILKISGMSCGHCVASVTKELAKLPGVTIEMCTIGTARVGYDEASTSREEIARAIGRAGFELADSQPA
jgi:copper chaperone